MSESVERTAPASVDVNLEAEQRFTDERLRLVAESMGGVVFDYDLVARTTFRNDAVKGMFGWDEYELTEQWWVERIHPDDFERVRELELSCIQRGIGKSWEVEYRFQRGDGSYATVLERGTVIRDDVGNPVRCVGTVSDVSDRARLADQRHQSQKMEAVGQLAGGIAHDFNNLLTAISCNVELLLEGTDPTDPRRDDIIQIREAATRAATLTRQLLAFSRRQVLQPRPLDLNATVANIERMLRRALPEGTVLQTLLDPALAPVHADAGQMEQVLMNLVLNARDSMPNVGAITVSTANAELYAPMLHRFGHLEAGRYVTLSVRDSGAGMTEETLDHLFEPFFTTKAQGKGTGLGLATVHGIVVQSGGQVVVQTQPDGGTEFRVYLPTYTGVVPQRRPSPAPGQPLVAGEVRTVLVVDDDDFVRDVAGRALVRSGYRVMSARGGDSALQVLAQLDPKSAVLVLTDVVMPGMHGGQLAERLTGERPGLRVAFMSGFSTDELARSGMGFPMRSFLIKPFTLPELVSFVEDAFRDDGEDGT
jgi:two-component system, cell cycle sensor histidine kinase and response regulator CckA